MKRELKAVALAITFLFSCLALAQDAPPPPSGSFSTERGQVRKREGESRAIMIRDGERGPIEFHMRQEGGGPFPPGKWWKNSELVQKVGISEVQVQQMEKIFQDTRLRLIDMHANLEKQ